MSITGQGMDETVAVTESAERVSCSRDWRCEKPGARVEMRDVPSVGRAHVSLARLCSRVPWFPMRAPVTVRPLAPLDSAPARALAHTALADAPYAPSMLAPLDAALRSESEEYRALVVRENTALIGLIVFGATAGALGAGRIYFVAVDGSARRRGLATALIEAACAELRSLGARFVAMEMPEEPRLDGACAVALRAGFRREGRLSDYVRDGVGLAFLRRDLADADDSAR